MGWGGNGKSWGGSKGGKGGKGWSGGKGWGWEPAWQPMWGKGWGKGKGGNTLLKSTPSDKKVWIGGLPEGSSVDKDLNKELKEHLSAVGCKFASVGRNGQGGAVFASSEEAQNAIATMNGSVFKGSVLQVDVWTKKEKTA
eukprot:TRINITY_DN1680_c3_g1_i1.p2 TRINITY_DN1680_c3_g1~~TRINITY_DN1680_c3_g1_i1.p2  ORF type:complete len:154 (+),score=47.64 TRINITY_DN1680_c3_g1_i1:44-463(+)